MNRLASLLFLSSLLTAGPLISCTENNRQEIRAEGQEAFTDFKRFVNHVSADTHWQELRDDAFSAEMNRLKADYNAKVAAVDRDIDHFTAEQRAEVDSLKNVYARTYDDRLAAHQRHAKGDSVTVATATTTTTNAPASPVYQSQTATYAAVPAAALRTSYEAFVRQVSQNKNRYTEADWHAVEADWQTLEARRAAVASQLSEDDRDEIAQERVKYRTLKSVFKAKNSEEARQIRQGAREVGTKLEKGARKVGVAAEGALEGAREALRRDQK